MGMMKWRMVVLLYAVPKRARVRAAWRGRVARRRARRGVLHSRARTALIHSVPRTNTWSRTRAWSAEFQERARIISRCGDDARERAERVFVGVR